MRWVAVKLMMKRLLLLALSTWMCLGGAAASAQTGASGAAPTKTLRYAFQIAETSFDPAQISDLYSRTVVAGILEAPLEFEFLASPARMRPNTAAAMPEVTTKGSATRSSKSWLPPLPLSPRVSVPPESARKGMDEP
jgi:ABC-type oligopeptide transport system substrate-binding subunit